MASWLASHRAEVSYTHFYQETVLPSLKHLDLVIAMGGPMSVNDESEFPWLRQEKQFIREAIDRGVAVLGMCLGAQLIASALGSRVYRNPVKEIGWFTIAAIPHMSDAFRFPSSCTVFHWHGETFDLPAGAILIASSMACKNQAFQLKENVMGLQFHLETTLESMRALVENCSADLVPETYVQSKLELYGAPIGAYARINGLMNQVLSYITRRDL
jgi:GMP synthase-like glutamine amidotransferase